MVVEALERGGCNGSQVAKAEFGQINFRAERKHPYIEEVISQLNKIFVDLDNPDYSFPLEDCNLPTKAKPVFQIIHSQIRRIETSLTVSQRELNVAKEGLRRYMAINIKIVSDNLPLVLNHGQERPVVIAA